METLNNTSVSYLPLISKSGNQASIEDMTVMIELLEGKNIRLRKAKEEYMNRDQE